jgi:hypothetical protein
MHPSLSSTPVRKDRSENMLSQVGILPSPWGDAAFVLVAAAVGWLVTKLAYRRRK